MAISDDRLVVHFDYKNFWPPATNEDLFLIHSLEIGKP